MSLAGLISAVGNSLYQERAVRVREARSGSLCALGPALLTLAHAGEGCMGDMSSSCHGFSDRAHQCGSGVDCDQISPVSLAGQVTASVYRVFWKRG